MTDGTNLPATRIETKLRAVLEKVKKPGGFASLTTEQRKFLLATLLAAVVPADGKVRSVELETLQAILKAKLNVGGKTVEDALSIARTRFTTREDIQAAAQVLPDLLSIEDRCKLVGNLWDMALCDKELHSNEERLIFDIADEAGVPRKRVAEQQARASAQS